MKRGGSLVDTDYILKKTDGSDCHLENRIAGTPAFVIFLRHPG